MLSHDSKYILFHILEHFERNSLNLTRQVTYKVLYIRIICFRFGALGALGLDVILHLRGKSIRLEKYACFWGFLGYLIWNLNSILAEKFNVLNSVAELTISLGELH